MRLPNSSLSLKAKILFILSRYGRATIDDIRFRLIEGGVRVPKGRTLNVMLSNLRRSKLIDYDRPTDWKYEGNVKHVWELTGEGEMALEEIRSDFLNWLPKTAV